MNQLEITKKEVSELLARQLQAIEDESFLGRDKNRDDMSLKRSERIRALSRELATIAAREQAR
jgi:hypothetical protein